MIKMKKSQLLASLLFILFLSVIFLPEVSAQDAGDGFGFGDDNVEDVAATIDLLAPMALLIGAYLGIKKLR